MPKSQPNCLQLRDPWEQGFRIVAARLNDTIPSEHGIKIDTEAPDPCLSLDIARRRFLNLLDSLRAHLPDLPLVSEFAGRLWLAGEDLWIGDDADLARHITTLSKLNWQAKSWTVQVRDVVESHARQWRDWFTVVEAESRGNLGANIANIPRLFPGGLPENSILVDLICRLDAEKAEPERQRRSDNEIARELTRETIGGDRKAQSLLAQIRREKREGRVSL